MTTTTTTTHTRRIPWRLAMGTVYLVGIVWHTLHPQMSVLSGRFQHPLTPFVDENAIDAGALAASQFSHNKRTSRKRRPPQQEKNKKDPDDTTTTKSFLCEELQLEQSYSPQRARIPCISVPLFSFDEDNNSNSHNDNNNNNATTLHGLQVAQIQPLVSSTVPTLEAIVLVVSSSPPQDELFGTSVVDFILHLTRQDWLAKTILVVAPVVRTKRKARNQSLQQQEYPNDHSFLTTETVEAFLDWYLGDSQRHQDATSNNHPPIPSGFQGAVIRQLLVVDYHPILPKESAQPKLLLWPTGRQGLMPNQDLYSTVFTTLRHAFVADVIHVYPRGYGNAPVPSWFHQFLSRRLPHAYASFVSTWWQEAWDFLSWEWDVATQRLPTAPHASALERGVDALTVQFLPSNHEANAVNSLYTLWGSLELSIHALSNAHERLHHNTALYTLPRRHGNAYVKHEEFLIPGILLLVPLILRAVSLIFTGKGALGVVHVQALSRALVLTVGGTLLVAGGLSFTCQIKFGSNESLSDRLWVGLAYVMLFLWSVRTRPHNDWDQQPHEWVSSRQGIQFAACLVALYLHLPLVFGYVALGFSSACLWTPPLAFCSWNSRRNSRRRGAVEWGLGFLCLLATSPMGGLVPNVFPSFTVYVKYVYVPLHLLTCVLWLE